MTFGLSFRLAAAMVFLVATTSLFAAEPAKPAARKPIGWGTPPAESQPKLVLWPEGAPGANGTDDEDRPWIWLYPAPADKANGTAVVICPGGGYGGLALGHEGNDVARWWNSLGVSAFVLKYRLAPNYRAPAPMQDVQRALRTVRAKAGEWKIDPHRIGVMGFSAGGHLASTAAVHFDDGLTESAADEQRDPIDAVSCRPDFAVLCYPVVAFGTEWVHGGSQKNLLGPEQDPKLVEFYANHKHVTPRTPPTFLFHTVEDAAVPPENSVLFFTGLRQAKVPVEMHLYEKGRHGVGLASDDAVLSSWSGRLKDWLMVRGLLK